MLAAGAAAEIGVDEQQHRALAGRLVERVRLEAAFGVAAHVVEQVATHVLERDLLEEARRDDAIRVDVVAAHDDGAAVDAGNAALGHAVVSSGLRRRARARR